MAKMSEARSEVSNVIEQQPAIEVLRKAGLDPAKLNPIERNYFETSLSKQMAAWKKEGKPVELEAAKWLEAKLTQKQEYLKAHEATPAEMRTVDSDLSRVHERLNILEKTELVAKKTGPKPPKLLPRAVAALEGSGISEKDATWKQRQEAIRDSMYDNPFETRAGKEVEESYKKHREQQIAQQMPAKPMPSFKSPEERERDALVQEQIAQLGPRKDNPFTVESKIKGMQNIQAEIMANEGYRAAIEDHNSRFPANQKTTKDIISDAVLIASRKKADVGPADSPYAIAVAGYATMLSDYARDRKLGSKPEERILAGLTSQERGMEAVGETEMVASTIEKKGVGKEPAFSKARRYEFTVAGLGSDEKSTTYEFNSMKPIDYQKFRHALDAQSAEVAKSNLALLGITGIPLQAIAEMRDGVQDPLARTELAEMKAKKGSGG